MCGVAGFVNLKRDIQEAEGVLNRMVTRIHHRGPDECGLFLDQGVGLGSVRLSIIDLKSGQQPLCNEDRSLWIVFNGEIFNFIELRDELVGKGHIFTTRSDTEVIIHLYEEYGVDALKKLNGQFVFCIWDCLKRELFIGRDRVGIRPAYYTVVNDTFLFGSEMKALFEFPGMARRLSPQGLNDVFTFWSAIAPNTVFEGIQELPPGSYLVFNSKGIKVTNYWSLNFPEEKSVSPININEALEEFSWLLRDSIRLRLRSDVPVAAYLSGGIDSSATTALIKEHNEGILNTFSIGFADNVFDETGYQQEVSSYFNTTHYSVKCQNLDIAEWLPRVIWHTETPILRTSPAPMMRLSQLVREHGIKVVITGEGADEALAGYNIFKEALIRKFWSRDINSKYRPLLLKKLYPYLPHIRNAEPGVLRMFFGYKLSATDSLIYSHLLRWHNTARLKNHFLDEVADSRGAVEEIEQRFSPFLSGRSDLAKAQFLESNIFMSGYLLSSQGDRMGMANSVEGRYPFLDHRLLEFASRLPDELKLKGMNEKFILKQLMQDKLPVSVLKRSKQAYRAPIAQAFLNEKAPSYIRELLSVSALKESGVFKPETVQMLIKKMEKSTGYSEMENMALVGILSTQLIYQKFIKEFTPLSASNINKGVVRNFIKTT